MTGESAVQEVTSRRDLREFTLLPERLYRGHPHWIPPLRAEVRRVLSDENPFFRHAERALFLARRRGEAVGRIAAFIDRLHLERHQDATGFFGFFECANRQGEANGLLDRAARWLRARGMGRIRGPVNPSMNEECGILVEGHDSPPTFMMPYTLPYYPALLEGAGFAKAMDLLSFRAPVSAEAPPRLARLEAVLSKRHPALSIRPVELGRFDREVSLIRKVYNRAWEANWGFVPMTEEEIRWMARRLRPLIDPELTLFAEAEGEPVAFALALPDYNQVLARLGGRMGPLGLLKFLYYRRRVDGLRLLALGVVAPWRRRGVEVRLLLELWRAARARGFRQAEASWMLEDNAEVIRVAEGLGGALVKRHRLYERAC
ncbi:MAG: GNAT family N-acetyltransferase [Nitrospinota bacterium]